MVFNFLSGGAAIKVFSKQHNIAVKIIDAGVKYDFKNHYGLIDDKISLATKNYLYEPAMTKEQSDKCIEKGSEIVREIHSEGTNNIGFGEMGIDNTSAASLLMSKLIKMPIEDCVVKGTRLDTTGVLKKKQVLKAVIEKHP